MFMHVRGTAIGNKITPPFAIIFIDSSEEEILRNSLLKPSGWWYYIDNIVMMWNMGKKSFKSFRGS